MSHVKPRLRPEAVLIAGPTASGKSALATRLAQRLGGRVINADSMQVYRDLRILTARPSEAEMAVVPHALYGTIDGATTYSVSLWLADARRLIADTKAEGLLPIFVGGTGLYFKALTQGLSDIPPVPEEIRRSIRGWAAGRAPEALHAELAQRDPLTASRLKPTDPQRVLRAMEVHEATGESLVSFHRRREEPALTISNCCAIAPQVPREILHERIDQRFDAMIATGALVEVFALAARHLDPTLPVMRALGVRPLLSHLGEKLSLDEAITAGKTASRQYVRRQQTFLRHQLPDFRPVPADQAEAEILGSVQS